MYNIYIYLSIYYYYLYSTKNGCSNWSIFINCHLVWCTLKPKYKGYKHLLNEVINHSIKWNRLDPKAIFYPSLLSIYLSIYLSNIYIPWWVIIFIQNDNWYRYRDNIIHSFVNFILDNHWKPEIKKGLINYIWMLTFEVYTENIHC